MPPVAHSGPRPVTVFADRSATSLISLYFWPYQYFLEGGPFYCSYQLFSWMRGSPFKVTKVFPGVSYGVLPTSYVPRGLFSLFSVMWASSILLLPIQHGRLAGFVETAGCAENIREWHDNT